MTHAEAERAVVDAALSQGFFTQAQLSSVRSSQQQLRQSGRPADLLPMLASCLDPNQQAHLRSVYNQALVVSQQQPVAVSDGLAPSLAPGTLGGDPAPAVTGAKRIGDYEVISELGRGGMGVVYEAKSVTLERRVALKVLLRGQGAGDEDVARFKVEARAAARLRHPNIVGVLEQGQDAEGNWYMAMELVEGESLVERLDRDGAMDPLESAEITRLMAEALDYAHGESVLHRDLKPHNVMINEEGTPLLTDFGLAKLVGDQGKSLTVTGNIMGTPAYMSPEQADGERGAIGKGSDIYSLGATLYHMLTGRTPFAGANVANVLLRVMTEPPEAPRKIDPEIPQDLETIVLKCLEKNAADRYPTMGALAQDLSRFAKDLDIVASRPDATVRLRRWAERRRGLVGVVAACVVAVLLIGGFALRAISDADRRAAEQARLDAEELGALRQEKEDLRLAAEREKAERAQADRGQAKREQAEAEQAQAERAEAEKAEAGKAEAARAEAARAAEEKAAEEAKAAQARATAERLKAERRASQERLATERDLGDEPRDEPRSPAKGPNRPDVDHPNERKGPANMTLPPWLMRRAALRRNTPQALFVAASWDEAQAEARARHVPIVLFAGANRLGRLPMVFEVPAFRGFLNQFTVFVVGIKALHESDGPKPPLEPRARPNRGPRGPRGPSGRNRPGPEGEPGFGPTTLGACPILQVLPCQAHRDVVEALRRYEGTERAIRKNRTTLFKLYMGDPEFAITDEVNDSPDWGLRPRVVAASLVKKILALHARMGDAKLTGDDYVALGELVEPPPRWPSKSTDRTKLCKAYRDATKLPAPFGDMAAFRTRELCRQAIDWARSSRNRKTRKSRLSGLKKEFQGDEGCLQLIAEANRLK